MVEHREGTVAHDVVVRQPATRTAPVRRASLHADGTHLALPDGRVVELRALPDPSGSRRVHRVLRRVERVDLTIEPDGVAANVLGIGHRRACRLPVSLPTALALVLGGAPGTVTFATNGAVEEQPS
jgi:hypothetical protein